MPKNKEVKDIKPEWKVTTGKSKYNDLVVNLADNFGKLVDQLLSAKLNKLKVNTTKLYRETQDPSVKKIKDAVDKITLDKLWD